MSTECSFESALASFRSSVQTIEATRGSVSSAKRTPLSESDRNSLSALLADLKASYSREKQKIESSLGAVKRKYAESVYNQSQASMMRFAKQECLRQTRVLEKANAARMRKITGKECDPSECKQLVQEALESLEASAVQRKKLDELVEEEKNLATETGELTRLHEEMAKGVGSLVKSLGPVLDQAQKALSISRVMNVERTEIHSHGSTPEGQDSVMRAIDGCLVTSLEQWSCSQNSLIARRILARLLLVLPRKSLSVEQVSLTGASSASAANGFTFKCDDDSAGLKFTVEFAPHDADPLNKSGSVDPPFKVSCHTPEVLGPKLLLLLNEASLATPPSSWETDFRRFSHVCGLLNALKSSILKSGGVVLNDSADKDESRLQLGIADWRFPDGVSVKRGKSSSRVPNELVSSVIRGIQSFVDRMYEKEVEDGTSGNSVDSSRIDQYRTQLKTLVHSQLVVDGLIS